MFAILNHKKVINKPTFGINNPDSRTVTEIINGQKTKLPVFKLNTTNNIQVAIAIVKIVSIFLGLYSVI